MRFAIVIGFSAAVLAALGASSAHGATAATIRVAGAQWGVSTCFIGGTEGGARFDLADILDSGINTFRVYGGMSRWEQADDDGVYGSPTIDQIKADANAVNWAWWDTAMTSPPSGTDYWWAVERGFEHLGWQGNARTIFESLKSAGVRTVLTLRPTDNNDNPAWAQQLNPPNSVADWNEWWEHVFATVYWLNVRNDYGVDDFEVHNEPNNASQGWRGSQNDYYELVRRTKDAIDYVYRTFLPGRAYRIHAPGTTGGSNWPQGTLQTVGSFFDAVNVHDYSANIESYTRKVHDWMTSYGKANAQLWLGEWATYELGRYEQPAFNVGVVSNMIRGARPGRDNLFGSHIFSFYDWRSGRTAQYENFDGLVRADGGRRPGYYAFRLGVRALKDCRPTYQSTSSSGSLLAITTKDALGRVNLLVTNSSSSTTFTVDADVSALIQSGVATAWRYSATELDAVVASPTLTAGHATLDVPPTSALLVRFGAGVDPPPPPPGDTTPPAAPGGLVAAAAAPTRVDLDWSDNAEADLASYRVYRSTVPGFVASAATLLASGVAGSAYADNAAGAATTYYYRVSAVDTSGNESAASGEAAATTPTPPQPPAGGTVNLARGKPTAVSSFHDTQWTGAKAVDGNASSKSRWWTKRSSTLPNEWITVDLGLAGWIGKIVVVQGDRWATSYSLQVSTDGVTWTTVHATSSGAKGTSTAAFAPAVARYVRMLSTAWYESQDRVKLLELEVY
jgi:hypothetical protein